MKRTQKVELVEQMTEAFNTTPHVVLATFRGLTVNQSSELRSKVRAAGGRYQVIKNRLAKRAASGTPVEPLAARFEGPCGVALHMDDPVVLAKTLSEFSKDNPQLALVGAMVDAKAVVDEEGVKYLASLPSLDELRAQLMALIQTPATTLVRLLGTPGTQLARVLDARREKEEGAA